MLELKFRPNIFWKDLPWTEIYACAKGGSDVLPSDDRHYAEMALYLQPVLLKRTAESVLGEVKGELQALEQKILGYQAERREEVLSAAQKIAEGSSDVRVEVDLDSGVNPFEQVEQGRNAWGSEEYRKIVQTAEIVSVDLKDKLRYTGLVMIAQGLIKMAEGSDFVFVPEVVGKRFHETYVDLSDKFNLSQI